MRGRGLKRGREEPFGPAGLDGDLGGVEPQGKAAFAGLSGKGGTQGNGRMATKRDLRFWREIANPPPVWISIGHGEGGFGIADLGRDPAHLILVRELVGDHDPGGISAFTGIGKGGNAFNSHRASLSLRMWFAG